MFDKLLLAACIFTSVSGCDLLERIKPDQSNRTPPPATAFYAPPVIPTTVAPTVVSVIEPAPVVVIPPVPYVEPWVDPSICVEAWRKPCP